jgi:hypothetical protein
MPTPDLRAEMLATMNSLAANRTTEPPSGRFSRLGGQAEEGE